MASFFGRESFCWASIVPDKINSAAKAEREAAPHAPRILCKSDEGEKLREV
jgi:hypothetical protein